MAFESCIAEIVAAGKGEIDEAEARRILTRVIDRASRHERDGLSGADAAMRAARELGDEERIAAAIEKRNMLINKMRREALNERVIPGKEVESVRAVLSGVEGKGRGLGQSIDAEAHANNARLFGGVIAELRQAGLLKAVMRRNKDFDRDVARELWRLEDPNAGAPTGNRFAEQAAMILHRWQEVARTMENDAGAHIGKLDHYVTRQSHDMEKVRGGGKDADFAAWRDFIEPKLDERTFEGIDNHDKFLSDVWHALASGIHETSTGADWLGFRGPGNLAAKLAAERKLHFKNADDWLAYNERFGRGNIIDSILRSLEHAGRNTALMRHLGTNPEAMFQSWVDGLRSAARDRKDFKTSDALGTTRNARILDTLTGKAAMPDNMTLAHIGRGIRVMQSLAKLGGVVLSSIPDVAVNVATLRWNGVPLLEAYARTAVAPLLGRRGGATREVADMAGVGIDGMVSRMMTRFHDEGMIGTGTKMVEFFHRANLLTYWTDSLKTGVGLILSNNLARNTGREFAALPARLQTTLQRYGIEAAEWNAIRRVEKRAADGKDYVLPGEIAALPDDAIAHLAKTGTETELGRIREDLRSKLGSYIIDQTREGMTESRASDRAFGTLGTNPGTFAGEAVRLLMQFKQYPMTFVRRSVGRELLRDGVDVAGLAHLIVATTLLGYVSMTAKELAKGRNPRNPQDAGDYAKLVFAAMQQGGGLGIYGDFLFGEANRLGGGFVGTLAGPSIGGTIEDVHRLLASIRDGSTTKSRGQIAAAEGLQVAKNNAPFVNLFYTRMVLDYFIVHRLQEAVNPGYLRRYEQRVKKENNQTFWLRPTASPY
jgi:hypothetical protein